MINKILRSIDYLKFGWDNEDYRFDNLIFLIKFKIDRFIIEESRKKFPDKKVLQCYRICSKLCTRFLFPKNFEQKMKDLKILFKIIVLYNENWYV